MSTIIRFCWDESGATAIEYGLIATVMAVGLIAALSSMKNEIGTMFGTIATATKNAN
ncbi:MAG: Flp family type IVb pilin [Alsobacter sp.]